MAVRFIGATFHGLTLPITFTEPFSASFWFQTTLVTNDGLFGVFNNASASNYFACFTNAAGSLVRWRFRSGGSNLDADSPLTIVANTWYHVLVVAGSTTSRQIYVDGGNLGSNAVARGTFSPTNTDLGRFGDSSPSNHATGAMAELGIWNASLGASDAVALAAGVSPLMVSPESLATYSPLVSGPPWAEQVGGTSWTALNAPPVLTHPPKVRRPGAVHVGQSAMVEPTPSTVAVPGLKIFRGSEFVRA